MPVEGRVIANGQECIMMTSLELGVFPLQARSVMFKKDDRIWGFDASTIRHVELKDDKELIVAYSLNGEIRSITIQPLAEIWRYQWKPDIDERPATLLHFAAPLRSYMSEQDYDRVSAIDAAHDREQKAARMHSNSSQPRN
ncbi:MAG: hypothetical protein HYY68_03750 [Thaumarchaeota archaeon]|nr:hypothetical protein [Nitrososphaerota archaeon]